MRHADAGYERRGGMRAVEQVWSTDVVAATQES